MDVKNKVIIITGASGGIGLEAARLLSSKGAKIVLAARSIDKLKNIEKELPGSFAIETDMRNPGDIKEMVNKTIEKFGRIDVLINNAGQGLYGPVENFNIDQFKQVFELNVVSVVNAMQRVIPIMRAQGGGAIINISSKVSKNYFPLLAGYSSTKYALNAISLTARQELAKDNIIVSVVHPKMTSTDFATNLINYKKEEVERFTPNVTDVDTPQVVAQKILESILTGVLEVEV